MHETGWFIVFIMGIAEAKLFQQPTRHFILRIMSGKKSANFEVFKGVFHYYTSSFTCVAVTPLT